MKELCQPLLPSQSQRQIQKMPSTPAREEGQDFRDAALKIVVTWLNWPDVYQIGPPAPFRRDSEEVHMHIIWKRPDGFQNAQPEDFRRIELSSGAHLWVHRHELDWYPFQVSGDWKGQQQTTRLNRLTNLLDSTDEAWSNFLEHYHDDELKEAGIVATATQLKAWIAEMQSSIKGETWEVEITACALSDVHDRLKKFLSNLEEKKPD